MQNSAEFFDIIRFGIVSPLFVINRHRDIVAPKSGRIRRLAYGNIGRPDPEAETRWFSPDSGIRGPHISLFHSDHLPRADPALSSQEPDGVPTRVALCQWVGQCLAPS